VLRSLGGIVLWVGLYAVIGVAVGSIIRAPAAAIVSVLIWLTIVETAVSGLVVSVGRWLPATAASALGNAPVDGLLPQVGAGFVLFGWAALTTAGALIATTRRDVT
jgi:ABC-2 type transport system permease protein